MTDGCWVQFWDDEGCVGPTIRFDSDGPTRFVARLDDYKDSDGSKAGNEANSLETGSRTWLYTYENQDFDSVPACFPPNCKIDDLDRFSAGGNISSFKIFDYKPLDFVDSTEGNPFAEELAAPWVTSQTINQIFRTVVATTIRLIPKVGSALSTLVKGLWSDIDNSDQVWASFQNYVNQIVAGVYWQTKYEDLNDRLASLKRAATDVVDTPLENQPLRSQNFRHLYDLVNDYEAFFLDEERPETTLCFVVPFATLRLVVLREHLQHYEYYYGVAPDQPTKDKLTEVIQGSITVYQEYLENARNRIISGRLGMISNGTDFYSGRPYSYEREYKETVENETALRLDVHNATGQMWKYFDPDCTDDLMPPVLDYAVGPFGGFGNNDGTTQYYDYSQIAEGDSRISSVVLAGDYDGLQGLQLSIDGVKQAFVGSGRGPHSEMNLAESERIIIAYNYIGTGCIGFTTNDKNTIVSRPVSGNLDKFVVTKPLDGSSNTALVGVSGQANDDHYETSASVNAVTYHFKCELSIIPMD